MMISSEARGVSVAGFGVSESAGVFSALGVLTFGEFFSSGKLTITEFDEYGAIGSPGKF